MAEDNKAAGLAWFLAGLGVGALVGILYAPKSGRETREELANTAREGSEYLRSKSKQTAHQVGEYVDKGRAQWEEFVERGKSLVNDQTTRVTAAVEAGRDAYKSASAETAE
ncbi:MAG: YtxH domain-containing protein [Terracidiphilus sp.]|nr:YtxH domain-containing protein [Terracidiphilus sp.]